jgi:hypothetical protein
MPELDDIIRRCREIYGPIGGEYREQAKEWTMPGGATLRLRFLESVGDASRYQGHAYTWIGVDEAGNYAKPDVVDLLRGCMRSAKGVPCYLRLTGNPGGPGQDWLNDRYIKPAPPGVPHADPETGLLRVFIPSMLADNPHIADPDEYRKRLQGAGPPHIVRAWLHGDWNARPEGGILRPELVIRDRPPELYRCYLGCDPAASPLPSADASAVAVWASARMGTGRDSALHFWLMHAEEWRADTEESTERLIKIMDRFDPACSWIEGGPVGRSMLPWIRLRMRESGRHHPLILAPHGGADKIAKAGPLQAALHAGVIHAVPDAAWWPLVRDRWSGFTGEDGMPDDLVDASGMPLRFAPAMIGRTQTSAPPAKVPRSSLERERPGAAAMDPKPGKGVRPLFGS